MYNPLGKFGNPGPPCMIDDATMRPATLNKFERSASVLCMGKNIFSLPSNKRIQADGDKSSLKRIVKNSLFGPPPSMAGSPSKEILRGFVKSNFCLKIEILSVRMDDRCTVSRVGASGIGLNLSNRSLTVAFSSSSFERVSSVKNVLLNLLLMQGYAGFHSREVFLER